MSTTTTPATYRNKKDGWWVLRDLLADGREFKNSTGSFRGTTYNRLSWGHRLSDDAFNVFKSCGAEIDYVIYSYNTPIAWHTRAFTANPPTWWVPSTKYSVTTTQHQNDTRVAVAQLPDSVALSGLLIENFS